MCPWLLISLQAARLKEAAEAREEGLRREEELAKAKVCVGGGGARYITRQRTGSCDILLSKPGRVLLQAV
jgi:hypothetical protein